MAPPAGQCEWIRRLNTHERARPRREPSRLGSGRGGAAATGTRMTVRDSTEYRPNISRWARRPPTGGVPLSIKFVLTVRGQHRAINRPLVWYYHSSIRYRREPRWRPQVGQPTGCDRIGSQPIIKRRFVCAAPNYFNSGDMAADNMADTELSRSFAEQNCRTWPIGHSNEWQ